VKVREDRSVRTRACYLAVGVTVDGDREALGIWWQDSEGAKFWLAILNDLSSRACAAQPAETPAPPTDPSRTARQSPTTPAHA
jgi:hypothetical protein